MKLVLLLMINLLRAKFFIGKHKHLFTIYIIPPHCHDTSSWNLSSCKARSYRVHTVYIMAADGLATKRATASATMILTSLKRDNSVPSCKGKIFLIYWKRQQWFSAFFLLVLFFHFHYIQHRHVIWSRNDANGLAKSCIVWPFSSKYVSIYV